MKMTQIKIMLLSLFVIIGCTSHAALIRDEQGRTILMKMVIEVEAEREKILETQSRYLTDALYTGCVAMMYGFKHAKKVDNILKDYRVNRDNQWKSLLGNITWMAACRPSQLDFKAKDNQGNTALNYGKTPEMYEILRSYGAPFQCDAFLYAYRKKCIISTITLGIISCMAYRAYKK